MVIQTNMQDSKKNFVAKGINKEAVIRKSRSPEWEDDVVRFELLKPVIVALFQTKVLTMIYF